MITKTQTWPRGPTQWIENRVLNISIPFTWNLSDVRRDVCQGGLFWDTVVVGGPAVALMPGTFADIPYVTEGHDAPGILQRINPQATRTTLGCTRKCAFCGIGTGQIEPGGLRELADWPDLPVICDNNLLAASPQHVERVLLRLVAWGAADFNQGIDSRLLTDGHAALMAKIKAPTIRLALDSMAGADAWERAYGLLRTAGIAKRRLSSYCLVGFSNTPRDAWARCEWVESHGVMALPMWFHELDAMRRNVVTEKQAAHGWSDYERRRIMQWFYQHREAARG